MKTEEIKKYSFWISATMLVIALSVQINTCSSSLIGAGQSIAKKANISRVQKLEIQMGKFQESMNGIKLRQNRMDVKLDRITEKLDLLLGKR